MIHFYNGITFNILAYLLIFIAAFLRLTKKPKNKIIGVFNLILSGWTLIFLMYLIKDYNLILKEPLNSFLNNYEVITNFIIASYIWYEYSCDKKNDKENYLK